MSILTVGDGAKISNLNVNDNLVINSDPTKQASVITVGDNSEINGLTANRNKVHNIGNKTLGNQHIIQELEKAISQVVDAKIQVALQSHIEELKQIPDTPEGRKKFNGIVSKLRDFAIDLGAKAVAEIAMKQMGF